MKRLPALVAAASLAAVLVAAPTGPVRAELPPQPNGTVSALSLFHRLAVSGERSARDYRRKLFGYDYQHELDVDHDGCWTRKEVAKRDHLTAFPYSVSAPCTVQAHWRSLYDGEVYADYSPQHLELDHLVALAEAWKSGADRWSKQRRYAFGNDLGYVWDLQLVTSSVNQDKGEKDPARWLPKKNVCTFVKAVVAVKYRWHLSVDRAEHAVLARELQRCGRDLAVLKPGTPDLKALAGF